VRKGREADFEEALKRFVARSLEHHGTTGAHLLHPTAASRPREYGILRSFKDEQHMREFYDSALFAAWESEVAEMVEGQPVYRDLHGLEAFFRDGGNRLPPARWRMAIVTWLGVYPVVLFWSTLLAPWLSQSLAPAFVTGFVTLAAVVTLTWLVMPKLTKLFSPWLHQGNKT
ncbi:MAG TPA: antibiotic biosynthesis monooxygenase, partial [Planctomycetaceae bacterium]|nr:antibiotic biosynthesis monooxygenase [Planctomycetaceae bacterium]